MNRYSFYGWVIFMISIIINTEANAQSDARVVLKKNEVLTGRVVEVKSGEFVKLEVYQSIVTIPYTEIAYIVIDPTLPINFPENGIQSKRSGSKSHSSGKPIGDWSFESINEGVVSVGVGAVEGINGSYIFVPNQSPIYIPPAYDGPNGDVFGGVYTSNGVGYKGKYFVGIGIGAMGHTGYEGDFTMPFAVDFRYRILSENRISPYMMLASGLTYHKGGVGSFDFVDGAGVSLRINDRLIGHALLSHTYTRFYGRLSAGSASAVLDGMYLNYFGLRAGVSFRF